MNLLAKTTNPMRALARPASLCGLVPAMLVCASACAAEPDAPPAADSGTSLRLATGFWSHHAQQRRTGTYRENNTGIGLEWQFAPSWQVNAGHYRNSVNRPSNYLQLGWSPLRWLPAADLALSAGANVGVVNGYPNIDDGYFATLVPVATAQWKRAGVNLVYIPSVGRIHGGYAAQFTLQVL